MVNTSFMRRAVWTLFAVFLASSLAADSYPPNILESQVVTLDAKAIESYANSKTPFELVLGGKPAMVVLAPAPVWPEEGLTVLEVGKDGEVHERIVKGNITYAGDVLGEDPETTEVRLTIAAGFVDGYVLSGTGWWFVEPLARFDPKAAADQYLVYAAHGTGVSLDLGDDWVKIDEVIDYPPPPGPRPWEIRVVMVGDSQYIFANDPLPFEARHASLINMVNGIYWGQTFRQFRIQASIGDFRNTFLTSTKASDLKDELKLFVAFAGAVPPDPAATPTTLGLHGLNNLHAYMSHLTTAKDLDGPTEGIADPFGRFALSRQQVGLTFKNTILASHEIGHNFGGTHEAEICTSAQRMILCAEFLPNTQPVFSDGAQGPQKNNRKTIRDFMAVQGF